MTKKETEEEAVPRVRKLSRHKSLKLSKQAPKPQLPPLLTTRRLVVKSAKLLWSSKAVFAGLAFTYALLVFVFVRGLSGAFDINTVIDSITSALSGEASTIGTSVRVLSVVITSSTATPDEVTSLYSFLVFIFMSLAIIWTLRRARKGTHTTVKEAMYGGMGPFVPFLVVLVILALMCLPAIAGSTVFNLVLGNGLATTILEKSLWAILFFLLVVLSFYLVSSAFFALYIVTMPGMTPILAIKSSRNIARFRRFIIMRRIIILPVLMLLVFIGVLLPIIIYIPAITEPVLYVLTSIGIVFGHTYLYCLYRELL